MYQKSHFPLGGQLVSRRPRASAGHGRRPLAGAIALGVGLLLTAVADGQENLLEQFFNRLPSRSAAPAVTEQPAPPPPARPEFQLIPNAASQDPQLPAGNSAVTIPLSPAGVQGDVQYQTDGQGRISLIVRKSSLSYVLSLLAEHHELNVVAATDIDAILTFALHNVTLEEALDAILSVANYTWNRQGDIIYVTSVASASTLSADVQGRQIEVFPLDYADAQDVLAAVTGFLSPVGQAFVSESDEQDNRKTQESVIVEDLPDNLARVGAFIHQLDRPPRQVLIEAHILEVNLKDDMAHGVNFQHFFDLSRNMVSLSSVGFANPSAAQSFFVQVSGGNLTSLIQLIKNTTDVKTLASPRILVVNEQTARIQVGEQLGFRITTTTETSTLESVEFLDVGVVLSLTPRISRDNRIILTVNPEVSSGNVNATTGLPEEDTTELSTSVMLDDGHGMVIGGLIKETDLVLQNKIPYLGDLYVVGRLFQRQETVKQRSEIIIVLIPRIQPYDCEYAGYEQGEITRATTPLLEGPLLRKSRPWAPKLPDAIENPRILRLPPIGRRYPWPTRYIRDAGTPQPQEAWPVPPVPIPVRSGPLSNDACGDCQTCPASETSPLIGPPTPLPGTVPQLPPQFPSAVPPEILPPTAG